MLVVFTGTTKLVAYSGERSMEKGEKLSYNFDMQITPVKPINWKKQVTNRFYHSNSDLSANYIDEALKNGANLINVHHKKDIYPIVSKIIFRSKNIVRPISQLVEKQMNYS